MKDVIRLTLERWTVVVVSPVRRRGLLVDVTSPLGYFFPSEEAARGFIRHFQDESQDWEPRLVRITVEDALCFTTT